MDIGRRFHRAIRNPLRIDLGATRRSQAGRGAPNGPFLAHEGPVLDIVSSPCTSAGAVTRPPGIRRAKPPCCWAGCVGVDGARRVGAGGLLCASTARTRPPPDCIPGSFQHWPPASAKLCMASAKCAKLPARRPPINSTSVMAMFSAALSHSRRFRLLVSHVWEPHLITALDLRTGRCGDPKPAVRQSRSRVGLVKPTRPAGWVRIKLRDVGFDVQQRRAVDHIHIRHFKNTFLNPDEPDRRDSDGSRNLGSTRTLPRAPLAREG